MYGVLMHRPAMNLKPSPRWQTRFNSAVLSTGKAGDTFGYRRSPAAGSIGDGTVDFLPGVQIHMLERGFAFALTFVGNVPNSGWDYLFIKDAILRRDLMTYSIFAGNATWTTVIPPPAGAFPPDYGTTETNIFLGLG